MDVDSAATQTDDPTALPTPTDQGPIHRFTLSKPALIAVLVVSVALILMSSVVAASTKRRIRQQPDLYAPRPATREHPARSKTQGLTRAVLDTFPTITWSTSHRPGRNSPPPSGGESRSDDPAQIEKEIETKSVLERHSDTGGRSANNSWCERGETLCHEVAAPASSYLKPVGSHVKDPVEIDMSFVNTSENSPLSHSQRREISGSPLQRQQMRTVEENDNQEPPLRMTTSVISIKLVTSSAIGGPAAAKDDESNATDSALLSEEQPTDDGKVEDMTCPICVESFEEGDLIRILPCAGRHHYHATCIDQWLMAHSICPLCRTDFQPKVEDGKEGERSNEGEIEDQEAGQGAPADEMRSRVLLSGSQAPADDLELQRSASAGNASMTDPRSAAAVTSARNEAGPLTRHDIRTRSSSSPSDPSTHDGPLTVTTDEIDTRRRTSGTTSLGRRRWSGVSDWRRRSSAGSIQQDMGSECQAVETDTTTRPSWTRRGRRRRRGSSQASPGLPVAPADGVGGQVPRSRTLSLPMILGTL